MRRTLGVLIACSAVAGAPIAAQPTASGADTLRAALAQAYLRVDRLTSMREMSDAERATANRAFDRTTLQFFAGRFEAAIVGLDSLTRALGGADEVPAEPVAVGRARYIAGKAPSTVRSELYGRLSRVDSGGALQQAHATAMARAGLLTDTASPNRTIELLTSTQAQAAALGREVAELEAGRDPYVGRSGDWWRELVVGAPRRLPARVIAPPSALARKSPSPLIIALHGAGGDENMFVDAYGAGVLTRLADSLGAYVVSPLANGFSAVAFDSVLAVMSRSYSIDSTRVYVIGHSMGAGIAASLANARASRIAAVVCIAGGAPITIEKAPPALFFGGGLDPVIPAPRVKAAADASIAAGSSAEFRLFPSEGHTLIVGRVLPEAVAWLFTPGTKVPR